MTIKAYFFGWVTESTKINNEAYKVTVRIVLLDGHPQKNRMEVFTFPANDDAPQVNDIIRGHVLYNQENDIVQTWVNVEYGKPKDNPDIMTLKGTVKFINPPFDDDGHRTVSIIVDCIDNVKIKPHQVQFITTVDVQVGDTIEIQTEFKDFDESGIHGLMIGSIISVAQIIGTTFYLVMYRVVCIGDATPEKVLPNGGQICTMITTKYAELQNTTFSQHPVTFRVLNFQIVPSDK